MNANKITVIKKWYARLGFPEKYNAEFEKALHNTDLSDLTTVEAYDKNCVDGKKNLLAYLYFCEDAERAMLSRGISADVITDTLTDIVTWCNTWSGVKGELYLGELPWLANHLKGSFFRLGRLQFFLTGAERDIPKYGIGKGETLVEVHIPEGKRLTVEDCEASVDAAREFFAKYFPESPFTVFTCHSWLLDDTLDAFLSPESGILRFAGMFDRVARDEAPALIRYLFSWDTTPENLKDKTPTSGFAAKIKDAFLAGTKFYEVLGVIPR